MGRFLLGSTVVMLFPKNVVTFMPDWAPTGRCGWAKPWRRFDNGCHCELDPQSMALRLDPGSSPG